jgi:hypothetical protein
MAEWQCTKYGEVTDGDGKKRMVAKAAREVLRLMFGGEVAVLTEAASILATGEARLRARIRVVFSFFS